MFILRRLVLLCKKTSKKKNENIDYGAIKAQKNELLQRFKKAKKQARYHTKTIM
jgi:hypothetical protein